MRWLIKSGTTGFFILLVLVAILPLSTLATPEHIRDEVPDSPVSDECHLTGTGKTVAVIHGSFTIKNSPPTLTNIGITQIIPHSTHGLKIDVEDRNTLRDIKELVVTIKMNESHGKNEKEKATYKWTPAEGWQLVDSSGNKGIGAAGSKEPDDLTATSGTWWLSFISGGKRVRGSYGDIYVEVHDGQAMDGKTLWGYQIQGNREFRIPHRLQAIFSVLKRRSLN